MRNITYFFVLGALKFYGPTSMNYDEELDPILLSDYIHRSAFQAYYSELSGNPVVADSYGMNGIGVYDCQTGDPCITVENQYAINFTSGTTYKLSLINSGVSTGQFSFWIDGHNFTVVSTDFVAIEPYTTDIINLAIGT